MTSLANGAESGTADTTTLSAGNSGGGDDSAFDTVSIGAGAALTFDSTHVAHGAHSYKYVPPNASAATYVEWAASEGSQTSIFGRLYLWGASNPVTSSLQVFKVLNSGVNSCGIQINNAGKIVVVNAAGSALVTFTNAITLSAWQRIEFALTFSTTVGTWTVSLYTGDSTTPDETHSGTGAAFTAAANTFRFMHAVANNQGSSARTFWFDDLQLNTVQLPGPVNQTVSDSETAVGADAGEAPSDSLSDADAGTGDDSGEVLTGDVIDSDTGSASDAGEAQTQDVVDVETSGGADAGESQSLTLSDTETTIGVDAEAPTWMLTDTESGVVVDAAAVAEDRSSAETAFGVDLVLVVEVVAPGRPSLAVIAAATDALLAMTVGQRAESVQFVVLDADLNEVGTLHPGREGMTITHDATRALARTLEGLFLRWDQIGDLDTLEHRIRPEWLLQNGVTFPLGVFVFAHDPRSRHALGADIHASLVDQSSLLEQSDGLPVSYPLGMNVGEAIAAEWRAAGFSHFTVDSTPAAVGGPLAWAPAATRGQRMRDLSALAGFLPPYFDNSGQGVSRAAPDLSIIAARFRYLRGTTIDRDSIVEDDDRLEASNRYVVVSTSGSDAPIVGVYDLPSSVPWSAARRRAIISKVETMQGIETSAQAAAIAKANAMSDPSLFTRVDFDAAADPRHDSWDVLTYDGAGDELAYLETGWRLELRTGGRHHHSARRSLIDA